MRVWRLKETNTHQDHVVAHVVGATALGHFRADDALHVVLDIGLIWSIYLDAEMGLVPEPLALSESGLAEEQRRALSDDARALHKEGPAARDLKFVTPAPEGCLIEEVEFYEDDDGCRVLVRGEGASLAVETSYARGELLVRPDTEDGASD